MSITVSIYDIFAFTIPGFIYLFTTNKLLQFMGLSKLEVLDIDFSSYWLPILLLAYLTGQLIDFLSHRLWTKLWFRVPVEDRAYKKFLSISPEEEINFDPNQWPLLFTVIRREDRATAEMIDRNIAISIMLRNVSFGLFLFGILNLFIAFQQEFSTANLLVAFSMMILSFISLRRGDYYNMLFYSIIYQHAVLYGKNLPEIINSIREEKTQNQQANEKG